MHSITKACLFLDSTSGKLASCSASYSAGGGFLYLVSNPMDFDYILTKLSLGAGA